MPVTPTYPGVYIEEIPSGVRTIVGVATSITAFIGRAQRGPTDTARTINSYADFERDFGGLWLESSLGYAVRDFYLNGGSQAIIVRLFNSLFSDEEERQKAQDAAQEVADAAAGDDATEAATAARAKADEIAADPNRVQAEKTAAATVATAAEAAAQIGGADAASVKKAAEDAVAGAAPFSKAKLKVGPLTLEAAYEGKWGANLRASVDTDVTESTAQLMGLTTADLFNLTVSDVGPGGFTERYLNLTLKDSPRRADKVLEAESRLVRWDNASPLDPANPPAIAAADDAVTAAEKVLAEAKKKLAEEEQKIPPDQTAIDNAKKAVDSAKAAVDEAKQAMADAVSDGSYLTKANFTPPNGEQEKKGLYALEQADLFNLLCIPPYLNPVQVLDVDVGLIADAAAYCEKRRAMLIVDPPKNWTDKTTAVNKFKDTSQDHVGTRSKNAALFFPRLRQPNLLRDNQMEDFAPCGAVAGVFARTDTQRGVWKAPAGLEATLRGVPALGLPLTDPENGELNPLGVNCLRVKPPAGRVVWGSRTLEGDDRLASEWKYIPVRRLALFIEESLYRGTQWVVHEPNDEPLWAQIRLNVGAFMHNLFRQGAFQGTTPREAYFVKCDKETTTQNDINLGIVNILVGFAPLKPAEFVIIKIQQLAGQIEA